MKGKKEAMFYLVQYMPFLSLLSALLKLSSQVTMQNQIVFIFKAVWCIYVGELPCTDINMLTNAFKILHPLDF